MIVLCDDCGCADELESMFYVMFDGVSRQVCATCARKYRDPIQTMIIDEALGGKNRRAAPGLPDDYQFYGSDEKKRLEIGNAVPPLLAAALAEPLLKALRENDKDK